MAFAAVEAGSSGGGLDRAEIGERKPAETLHSAWWRRRWREGRFRFLVWRFVVRARVIRVAAEGSQYQLLPLEELLRFEFTPQAEQAMTRFLEFSEGFSGSLPLFDWKR